MSEQSVLPAAKRERAGKGAARAVRRQGLVPCVVYGDRKDPQMISIEPRHLMRELMGGHFYNTVYELDVEGGKKERALPRDMQLHPVTDLPLHVDFLRVGKSTKINVNVPVSFINEDDSPGLDRGGILSVVRYEVELYCAADDIPEEVVCDLTGYEMGDTIHISNLKLPEGVVSAITDRDPVVANIDAPRSEAAVEEIEAEDQEAGEEFGADSEAEAAEDDADEGDSDAESKE
ncbi:50S ribosomal protein L25/general stress protein Ctc [Marivibrio halodurans]|uniref:Large ribosomal subunit protein bL25 n=1 Tax=Marivibrio halodurans TaxID=2039722 RepID=A0A8J7V4B8_9PROT|nr:50S ribosomal protein L25/general stress protein Ctc [Marivibrio halodurans]MBP5858912.1 50S ribosomal protein L25/general stress protein Ctc [Marivibrio halodurans]